MQKQLIEVGKICENVKTYVLHFFRARNQSNSPFNNPSNTISIANYQIMPRNLLKKENLTKLQNKN